MQILKRMMLFLQKRLKRHLSNMWVQVHDHYGYLALVVLAAVIVKNIMFYTFMDVSSYFTLVLAVTCIFIFILFSAFRNKWVPASLYMLWSIFMFGDVLYHKYFNGTLSVKLINSIALLSDVTSSVEGVLKPQYFIIFIDNIAIFAMLILSSRKQKKAGKKKTFHEKKYTKSYDYRKMANVFISVVLIAYIVLNPFCTDAVSSVATQEELSNHIRDILGTSEIMSDTEYYLSTGSYEKSLVEAGVASVDDYSDTDIDFSDIDDNDNDSGKDGAKSSDSGKDGAKSSDGGKDSGKSSDSGKDGAKSSDSDKDSGKSSDSDKDSGKSNDSGKDSGKSSDGGKDSGKSSDGGKDSGKSSDGGKDSGKSSDGGKDSGKSSDGGKDSGKSSDSSDENDSTSLSDETVKNLFGAGEGKNLIVIQLEAFQNFAINMEYNGQELTPFLNSLIDGNDTLYFDHYYYQTGSGNTSDAEFATLNSLLGTLESYTYTLYNHNYYNGLPVIMNGLGYDTAVMHAYDRTFWNRMNMYPSLGFEHYFDDDYYEKDPDYKGWNVISVNDENFYSQSIEAMKTLDEPFCTFMITLSGHHPFSQENTSNMLELSKPEKGTIVGDYFNTVRYVDQALETLFDQLKEEGLYENSVICLYGDHYGLTCTDSSIKKIMTKLLGEDYGYKWHFNIPLIINIPGSGVSETITTAGGQLDFLPTISYIMGIKRLDTLYLGQNLITADEGFVPIQQFLKKGSFINDDVVFFLSESGVYSNSQAWDVETGEQTSIEGYEELVDASKSVSDLSQFYLENDAIDAYVNNDATIDDILDEASSEEEEIMPSVISRPIRLETYEVMSHRERDYRSDAMSSIRKSYENGVRCMEIAAAPDDIYDNVIKNKTADETGNLYNSKTLIRYSDVASILNEFDDLQVVLRMVNDKNKSYEPSKKNDYEQVKELYTELSDCIKEHDSDLSRCIIKTDNMDMYLAAVKSGSEKTVLYTAISDYKESKWKDFFMSSKPWALFVNDTITEKEYELVEDAECPIYIVADDVWEQTESDTTKDAVELTDASGRIVNYATETVMDSEEISAARDDGEKSGADSIIFSVSNGKNPAFALALTDVLAAFAAFLSLAWRYAFRSIKSKYILKKSLNKKRA